jgi:uroporphyrinogen decarboxylase
MKHDVTTGDVYMNSKERVLTSLNHVQPDRTPVNLVAVNEIRTKLVRHFKTDSFDKVMEALQIDCREIYPGRIEPIRFSDGSYEGWGGSLIRTVQNQYGSYDEVTRYILDQAKNPDDVDRLLKLPNLDDYDFSMIPKACKKYRDHAIIAGECSLFRHVTYIRSMEDLLLDMALNEELVKYIIKRVSDWLNAYHGRLFDAGKGQIDIMYLGSDFSTQRGLLFSIDMYKKYFKEPIRKFVELGKSYGAKIFFHICGSAYEIIPELIDVGIDILDPVQTTALNMEPAKLKREFGDRLTFHGAIDTQRLLPRGTPDEVRREAGETASVLCKDGGYILASCHAIQADVPVENILALYDMDVR